jgi:Tfp pilus assembly PilM family ATPase
MSTLSIYFGPKVISIVESEGKKVINNILLPQTTNLSNSFDEKVPDEIKIATIIKDELRNKNIEAKQANLILPGKVLIIRTFHMPILPASELYNAVRFEAKKYIPFKIEELVCDFQFQLDMSTRKNFVLFFGMKKEILDKYMSVLAQLDIKVGSVEYSGFALLRLLNLARVKEKGIYAVINTDLAEEDEINYLVLENGFPLFSRDIILAEESPLEAVNVTKMAISQRLEKLKAELRISFDFYLRKFPTKNINNVFIVSSEDYRSDLDGFVKERGLATQFLDVKNLTEQPVAFSLSFFKAFAGSLGKTVKRSLKIDLLQSKAKTQSKPFRLFGITAPVFLMDLRINSRIVILAVCVIVGPFIVNFLRQRPIINQINQTVISMPKVSTVPQNKSVEELSQISQQYKEKIKTLNVLLRKRFFVTGYLDGLPRVISKGIWLKDLLLRNDDKILSLDIKGYALGEDSDKELQLVNKFLSDLKEYKAFRDDFKSINIVSVDRATVDRENVTSFSIICKGE